MGRTNTQSPRKQAAPGQGARRRTTALTAKELVTGQTKVARTSTKRGEITSRSVECPQCKKVISRKADLPRHMRLHMPREEVETKCTVEGCTFATIQKNNLKTHLLTHTRETPHKCPYDGCKFEHRDPSSLTRHKKNCHGYVPYYGSHGGNVHPADTPRQVVPKVVPYPSSASTSSSTSPMAPPTQAAPSESGTGSELSMPCSSVESPEPPQGQLPHSFEMGIPPPASMGQSASQWRYNGVGQLDRYPFAGDGGVYPMSANLPTRLNYGYFPPPNNPFPMSSQRGLSSEIYGEINQTMVPPHLPFDAGSREMGQFAGLNPGPGVSVSGEEVGYGYDYFHGGYQPSAQY